MSTNARPAMLSYLQANPQVFVVVHGDLNSMKFNPFPHFLIFSFASLETTHAFPDIAGPPGFVAIQGKIYHRIRPTHQNSAVRWLLHDGFMMNTAPHQNSDWASALPEVWKCAFRDALLRVNPFVTAHPR